MEMGSAARANSKKAYVALWTVNSLLRLRSTPLTLSLHLALAMLLNVVPGL